MTCASGVSRAASAGARPARSPTLYGYYQLWAYLLWACLLATPLLTSGASAGTLDPVLADPDWHIPVPAASEAELPPQYARLAAALAVHESVRRQGGWPEVPPGPALHSGDRDRRVVALRNRLRASGDYRAEMQADPWYFDTGIDAALRRFQWRHGLPQTGVLDERSLEALNVTLDQRIDQLGATLERWRWLPAHPPARHVWINTAAATAELFEAGRPVLGMRAIVGHPSRATPSFASELRAVVFNPTWSVPHTIAVEDLLPRQQEDAGYLARHGFRVFQYDGGREREIAPRTIAWQSLGSGRFPYQLRQNAGAGNALGRIKLVMDNPYGIYLHDTPEHGLFGLNSRTLGSGCVRLEDARAFTTRLIAGERPWSERDTDGHIDSGRTLTLPLREPVPVYIVYLTAWADDDGTVHFRRDLYGRDARLLAIRRAQP